MNREVAPDALAGWRWTGLTALVGFSASLVLSGLLGWPRAGFVAAWSAIGLTVFGAYLVLERIDVRVQLRRHWKPGLVTGLLVGGLLWVQVTSQPVSTRASGAELAAHLAGYGLIYGVVDALLLTVIPVLTLYGARPADLLRSPGTRLRWALAALAGSVLVTAAYHAGFQEFRGAVLIGPVIGNSIITLGYLLSGSPIASILAHVIMHVAAVLHGMETTIQLPPH